MNGKPMVHLVMAAGQFGRSFLHVVFSITFFALVLEFLLRTNIWSNSVIPLPSEIVIRFYEIGLRESILFDNIRVSLARLAIGYTLSVSFGLMVGAVLGQSALLKDMFQPSLSFMMSIPTIAWVPFLLVSMGLGDRTILTAIFLGGFFAVAYNTMEGMRCVDRNLINAGRNMELKPLKMFLEVYLPGSMIHIITGLKLGMSYSWRALIGAEMFAAMISHGVGKMVIEARIWNDLATMVLGVATIGVIGLLVDRLVFDLLERKTIKKWGVVQDY